MKNKWILLISLIMLLGMSAVASAGPIPATYDFDDFVGTSYNGWEISNGSEVGAAVVDEEHGKSVKLATNASNGGCGILTYSFPEPLTEGRLLINFEINVADLGRQFRIHAYSPTTETDLHSLFYMADSKICSSAATGAGGWTFPKMTDYYANQWYRIDMLIDMDAKRIYYYVDGVYCTSEAVQFKDLSELIFRPEGASKGDDGKFYSILYFDNFQIKYLSGGTMSYSGGTEAVKAGTDKVQLGFSDLIDPSSLNAIKAYCVGTNPIEYQAQEVQCEVESTTYNTATVKFAQPFVENVIYKIEIPGAASLYGDEYSGTTVYFPTTRETEIRDVIDTDFTSFQTNQQSEITNAGWVPTGSQVNVTTTQGPAGTDVKTLSLGSTTNPRYVTKTLAQAVTGSLTIEYNMKATAAEQRLVLLSSTDATTNLITFKADGIYSNETKITDYIANSWMRIKAEVDIENSLVDITINDITVNDIAYAGADVSKVRLYQRNNNAASYISDFKLSTQAPKTSVQMVRYKDKEGNIYYPDNEIPSTLTEIIVEFSANVTESTIASGIELTVNNATENYIPRYDEQTHILTLDLPEYLLGNKDYALKFKASISDGVAGIVPVEGTFHTKEGVYQLDSMRVGTLLGTVTIDAEITHTNESTEDMYLIYAAFDDPDTENGETRGTLMVDYDCKKIEPTVDERKIILQGNGYSYTPGVEYNRAKVYLWDGLNTMIPIAECKTTINNQ